MVPFCSCVGNGVEVLGMALVPNKRGTESSLLPSRKGTERK